MGEVVDGPAGVAQGVGQDAEQQALSAAGLGDEHGDAVELDAEAQAGEGLDEATVLDDGVGRGAACEGVAG